MNELVKCGTHGKSEPIIVCEHLINKSGLGYTYIEAIVEHDEDDYDTVMCEACENILLEDQAWSDRLYDLANFNYYCSGCVKSTLSRHHQIRGGSMKCV